MDWNWEKQSPENLLPTVNLSCFFRKVCLTCSVPSENFMFLRYLVSLHLISTLHEDSFSFQSHSNSPQGNGPFEIQFFKWIIEHSFYLRFLRVTLRRLSFGHILKIPLLVFIAFHFSFLCLNTILSKRNDIFASYHYVFLAYLPWHIACDRLSTLTYKA